MQQYSLFLCPITCHSQSSIIMLLQGRFQAALHVPLCHSECLSLSLYVSPVLSVQRHTAMMGFSDGIKMSSPTAVTHANCIVSRFYHWEQPAVCFVWCLHFILCHDVIICGTAASLVNVLDSRLLIFLTHCLYCAGLPTFLHGLVQHLQYSYTVSLSSSVAAVRQPVWLKTPVVIGKITLSNYDLHNTSACKS